MVCVLEKSVKKEKYYVQQKFLQSLQKKNLNTYPGKE